MVFTTLATGTACHMYLPEVLAAAQVEARLGRQSFDVGNAYVLWQVARLREDEGGEVPGE